MKITVLKYIKYTFLLFVLLQVPFSRAYVYKMSLIKNGKNIIWFLYDSHNCYEEDINKGKKKKITKLAKKGLIWAARELNAKIYVEDGNDYESRTCPLTGICKYLTKRGINVYDDEAENRGKCEDEIEKVIKQTKRKAKKTHKKISKKLKKSSALYFLVDLYNWGVEFFGIETTKSKEKGSSAELDSSDFCDYNPFDSQEFRRCREKIVKKIKETNYISKLSKILHKLEAQDKQEGDGQLECFLNDIDTIIELLKDSNTIKNRCNHSIVFVGGYHAKRVKKAFKKYFEYELLCSFKEPDAPGLLDIKSYFVEGINCLRKVWV